jgi:cytochrome b6-f complex iron-sulfur subunit
MTRKSRRVDRWLDDLIHDRSPRRLRGADAEDAEALRAAIELRSATPGAGMPDPQFVEALYHRIGRETQGIVPQRARLSRRGLLAAGGAAAAAAAAGLVVGERLGGQGTPDRNLVADGAGWVDVAALADVPSGTAMRFSTPSLEGFVVNRDGTSVEALSAACTHLGCILRFNRTAQRLDCPCHRAAFALDGSLLFSSLSQALPPLPRLQTRVRDGRIEVLTI